MTRVDDAALDAIERYIQVSHGVAQSTLLAEPAAQDAAHGLYEIAQKILDANRNMARLLSRFVNFDFGAPDARETFLSAVTDYEGLKAGGGLSEMKYHCSDILYIYRRQVAPRVSDLAAGGTIDAREVEEVFAALGDSDGSMVRFIHDSVVGAIDDFVADALPLVRKSDFNAVERRRLKFARDVAELSARLARFGGDLVEVAIQYARAAGRPVSLGYVRS